MQNENRELWADYAKGICILLVAVGHYNELPQLLRLFIYFFHMPVFFFCMGFYINTSVDFKTYFKKKVKGLLVPFYVYGISYIILANLKQYVFSHQMNWNGIYSNLIGLFINYRNTNYPTTNWFLIASFIVCIYYYIMRRYINKLKIELCLVIGISVLFTYLSHFLGVTLPWYLDVAFPCLLFVYIGSIVRNNKDAIADVMKRRKIICVCGGGIAVAAVAITYCILSKEGTKYLIDYHTLKLFPYTFVTLGGVLLCLLIYVGLCKIERKSFLSYIGENSLIYYLFDPFSLGMTSKLLSYMHITNGMVCACSKIIGIVVFTPLIVMIIKYLFWFLFGKKREEWSFDYSKLLHRCTHN